MLKIVLLYFVNVLLSTNMILANNCSYQYNVTTINDNIAARTYNGTWYGIRKKGTTGNDCLKFNIRFDGDYVKVLQKFGDKIDNNLTGSLENGTFHYANQTWHFVNTNATNFTILYACHNNKQYLNNGTVIVLSRNRQLNYTESYDIDQWLMRMGVNQTYNIDQNVTKCGNYSVVHGGVGGNADFLPPAKPGIFAPGKPASIIPNSKPSSSSQGDSVHQSNLIITLLICSFLFCLFDRVLLK